jgi:hypothetical protein
MEYNGMDFIKVFGICSGGKLKFIVFKPLFKICSCEYSDWRRSYELQMTVQAWWKVVAVLYAGPNSSTYSDLELTSCVDKWRIIREHDSYIKQPEGNHCISKHDNSFLRIQCHLNKYCLFLLSGGRQMKTSCSHGRDPMFVFQFQNFLPTSPKSDFTVSINNEQKYLLLFQIFLKTISTEIIKLLIYCDKLMNTGRTNKFQLTK